MKIATFIIITFLTPLSMKAQGLQILDSTYTLSRGFLDIIPELEMGFPIGDLKSEIDKGLMIGKGLSVFIDSKICRLILGFGLAIFPMIIFATVLILINLLKSPIIKYGFGMPQCV